MKTHYYGHQSVLKKRRSKYLTSSPRRGNYQHAKKKVKGQSVQFKRYSGNTVETDGRTDGQTDTTDCSTFPANAVSNNSNPQGNRRRQKCVNRKGPDLRGYGAWASGLLPAGCQTELIYTHVSDYSSDSLASLYAKN